ncbi:thioredoxin domain-containing protein [bacterium]|nr:thioredoxin domain-containing protein [bacterium]
MSAHGRRAASLSREDAAALPADGGPEYNRLIFEKSPYLLQHAGNPVDWYPWSDEAFARAAAEDKPVFLSIGYATCHWCHVMEREAFEDEEVAAILNSGFICIKVDREERPDIDKIYMTACQAMTRSGGWPLTIIMTPDKRPFFAGTYIPKTGVQQHPGLLDLLPRVLSLWSDDRERLTGSADEIVRVLRGLHTATGGERIDEAVLDEAFAGLRDRFDSRYGGFGQAPKFPSPHTLIFLLRYGHRRGNDRALEMAAFTLEHMRMGGIFDQVGLGMHRYATDREWLLPHFEKMLYDQALTVLACLEAFQAVGEECHARTAREILSYVLRELTSPEGGFYSAEDADSEGEEGLYYLWTPEELEELLGEDDAGFVRRLFGVEAGGNFRDQSTGRTTGRSIFHLKESLERLSETEPGVRERWEVIRPVLLDRRSRRAHPLLDDKILTDWNGLMIAALARAGMVLENDDYTAAAARAAAFILRTMRNEEGRLLKRYREGEAALPAHLEDYAFMVWGLIELYEATFEAAWLEEAVALNERMLADFRDNENGGLFFTSGDGEELLFRSKEIFDDATPSGNSAAALNLLRLARLTGSSGLEREAGVIMNAFAGEIRRLPMGATHLLSAVMFSLGPTGEVVIAGSEEERGAREMLRAVRRVYAPGLTVLYKPADESTRITRLAPFTEPFCPVDGNAAAYVCRNFSCSMPVTDIGEMLALITAVQTPGGR